MNARTIASGLGLAAALVVGSVVLSAHMVLQKSEPAANAVLTEAPPHIQLFFNEAPDLKVSKLEIKGPSPATKLVKAHVMDKSLMAMIEGAMPDGAYTVEWQAAGDDGHVQKGELKFSLKHK